MLLVTLREMFRFCGPVDLELAVFASLRESLSEGDIITEKSYPRDRGRMPGGNIHTHKHARCKIVCACMYTLRYVLKL